MAYCNILKVTFLMNVVSKLVWIFFAVSCTVNLNSGYGSHAAAKLEVLHGDRVVLRCHTNLDESVVWCFKKHFTDKHCKDIVLYGDVINGHKDWCELRTYIKGDFDLVIRSITVDYSGYYTCTEDDGQGTNHVFNVKVLSSLPVQNNIQGDSVNLTCRSSQYGTLTWKFSKYLDDVGQIIAENGRVKENMIAKFRLDHSVHGFEKLTIDKVVADDMGLFICLDDDANKQYMYLRVSPNKKQSTLEFSKQTSTPTSDSNTVMESKKNVSHDELPCDKSKMHNDTGSECNWKAVNNVCGLFSLSGWTLAVIFITVLVAYIPTLVKRHQAKKLLQRRMSDINDVNTTAQTAAGTHKLPSARADSQSTERKQLRQRNLSISEEFQ